MGQVFLILAIFNELSNNTWWSSRDWGSLPSQGNFSHSYYLYHTYMNSKTQSQKLIVYVEVLSIFTIITTLLK